MSSSGRYQSQVLSFLSQQSLKLRDRTLRGLRQVKVAAVWGAQVLLYPVYLAFQTTRLVSRQIGRSVHRVLPTLRAAAQTVQQSTQSPSQSPPTIPPQTDTPIRRTLQSLQIFGLPVPLSAQIVKPLTLPDAINPLRLAPPVALQLSDSSSLQVSAAPSGLAATESAPASMSVADAPLPSQPQILGAAPIRGIATLLASRRLVLVDIENRVQDVLTPQQEIYLKRRIIWELADFWREQRRFLRATGRSLPHTPHPFTFLPPPADRDTLAPPVRAFRRLMAWMQTSPVAIAVNLFQESRLVPSPSPTMAGPDGRFTHPLAPDRLAPRLPPAPAPPALQPSLWQRVWNVLQTLNPLVDQEKVSNDPNQGNWAGSGPLLPQPSAFDAQQLNARRLSAELRGTWFDPDYRGSSEGWQSANQLSQSRRHREFPPIVPSLPVRAKPYLVAAPLWSSYASLDADLTDAMEGAIARIQPLEHETTDDVDAFMLDYAAASVPIQELEHHLVDYLQQTDLAHQRSSLAAMTPGAIADETAWDASVRQRTDSAMAVGQTAAGEINQGYEDESDEATLLPTWIETKATLVRYEKHPLEQLLEWIDLGMLWVEQKITTLFEWMRSRFTN
ncbi:MAG: hypothetical protein ACFB8W_20095 [Elainellaceae cyanobacterium]